MLDEITTALSPASRKRRIAAFAIDHFIISFIGITIAFSVIGSHLEDYDTPALFSTLAGVVAPIFLIYFIKDAYRGVSIGKWILGIVIRDADDSNNVPSLGRLMLRNVFLFIWPIEALISLSRNDKRRLGDLTATTQVYNNPHKAKRPPRVVALSSIAFVYMIVLMVTVGGMMKTSGAYITAIAAIESNAEILEMTGGIEGYGMMPTGSIQYSNGQGNAYLEISVDGKEEDVSVRVLLTKVSEDTWVIDELSFEED